ncbi:hypothetical protein Scep_016044 [Stephania cephalantha]|uniref:NB-ARC domain-containing protein n=1 Tax=Stephania cephalantha TaxID=152367 RepID=A0AAP0ILU9_9MAGN
MVCDFWTALITPLVDLVKYLWNFLLKHASYICNLQENLTSLEGGISQLRNIKEEVDGKVQMAEAQQRPCRPAVRGWLVKVQGTDGRVTSVVVHSNKELQDRCSSCCPKLNCCRSYKLGKEVVELIAEVQTLTNEANAPEFQDVADTNRTIAVQGIPIDPTTEFRVDVEPNLVQDLQGTIQSVQGNAPQEETDQSNLAKALRMIGDANIDIVGIYGMGGVGKTFLLNNINNHFRGGNGEWKVIHVEVSKELNLGKIQKEIGHRVGFDREGDNLDEERRNIIFNMLSMTKFLLLLDDCWERVDLQAIGIPSPRQCQNGGKIVFTSRWMRVCGDMGAQDTTIQVRCFEKDGDEAWQLFQRVVGRTTLGSDPRIPELARNVARECCGLPLALVTIGKTMSTKRTHREWENCLTVVQNSGAGTLDPEITEVTELQIFAKLKFSYDDLRGIHKPCFLYCALYPEDFYIQKDQLIRHWTGQGFLDGFESMDEAYDSGYGVIETLKAANLLESVLGSDIHVKMHDTIRDLAIWIGRECGRRANKVLVRSGAHFSEASLTNEECNEVERISLMRTSIRYLGDLPAVCTNLSTLLLKENHQLNAISDNFFQFMPALKVLNLSSTGIGRLPTSISHLVALEFMDLSYTRIRQLPGELRSLVRLKYLDLSFTDLTMIPQEVISHLSGLRMLDLHGSDFENWRVDEPGQGNAAGTSNGVKLSELQQLRHLIALGLTVSSTAVLQYLVSDNELRISITNLVINRCSDVVSINVAPSTAATEAVNSVDLQGVKSLQFLDIRSCNSLRELTVTWTSTGFKRFETLQLYRLTAFTTLSIQREPQSITPTLQFVEIIGCHALEDLTCFIFLPYLKRIVIQNCTRLRRIINNVVVDRNTLLSGLKKLELHTLDMLESIYEHALPFPHLETITVHSCPLLLKLPLNRISAKDTLQIIHGDAKWWEDVKIVDGETKAYFQRFFNRRN